MYSRYTNILTKNICKEKICVVCILPIVSSIHHMYFIKSPQPNQNHKTFVSSPLQGLRICVSQNRQYEETKSD